MTVASQAAAGVPENVSFRRQGVDLATLHVVGSNDGLLASADNLTRVTVDGSSSNKDFLVVTVNRPGAEHVLSWKRIPYTS